MQEENNTMRMEIMQERDHLVAETEWTAREERLEVMESNPQEETQRVHEQEVEEEIKLRMRI
jgi:hypothetical protein